MCDKFRWGNSIKISIVFVESLNTANGTDIGHLFSGIDPVAGNQPRDVHESCAIRTVFGLSNGEKRP